MTTLVEIIDCDPEAFVPVFNEPLFAEYRMGPYPFGPKDSREVYIAKVARWHSREEFAYGIELDGQIAGLTSIHSINWTHKYCQIFYWMAQGCRRRGVAKSAVSMLMQRTFEERGFNRIEALLRSDNEPSRLLLEHLGFTREASLKSKFINNDRTYDGLQYAMVRADYSAAPPTP